MILIPSTNGTSSLMLLEIQGTFDLSSYNASPTSIADERIRIGELEISIVKFDLFTIAFANPIHWESYFKRNQSDLKESVWGCPKDKRRFDESLRDSVFPVYLIFSEKLLFSTRPEHVTKDKEKYL